MYELRGSIELSFRDYCDINDDAIQSLPKEDVLEKMWNVFQNFINGLDTPQSQLNDAYEDGLYKARLQIDNVLDFISNEKGSKTLAEVRKRLEAI